jgi:Mg-chelatase subunit ChlD
MRLLCLALTPFLLLGQQPPEPETTIKVDVDLVSIYFSVRDKKGGLIPNAEKPEFSIFEDGKQQEIKFFTKETNLPLTLGLLVDVSGSQARLIEDERRAAAQFFPRVLRQKDMAFLISFGAEAELLQDFTNSTRLLRAGLDGMKLNTGVGGIHASTIPNATPKGTILYDTVYLAANEKLKSEVGRKALVLITDGMDQGSSYRLEQAVEMAQKSDAIIYSIALVLITDGMDQGSSYRLEQAVEMAQKSDAIIYSILYADPHFGGGFYHLNDSALRKMSEETGGKLFRVDNKNPLDSIFDQIQNEMRSQYTIGYSPTNTRKDGSFRKIEIRMLNKDYKVQARKGYYAVK